MTKKLTAHASAQCHIELNPNSTVFVSYTTPVIIIDTLGWLEITGLYSMTTRKQIGWFLKEYAPSITFQMVKQCLEDDMMINIHTGEVIPLFK